MNNQYKIKVAIADDHEIYRHGLRVILEKNSNVLIVAEAGDGNQLIDQILSIKIDIIIIDIKMPNLNGIETTKELKKMIPDIKIIALTMYNNETFLKEMLGAAVNGFLLKTTEQHEIIDAINIVNGGGFYYCTETSLSIKKYHRYLKETNFKLENKIDFTPRELEIINLICLQLTTKEIATKLKISHRTVDSHRNIIQQKMDSKNMVGIVLYAIKHELFRL